MLKREKIWQSAAKPQNWGRFRDYNRNYQFGKWYSPFLLETIGTKRSSRPPCKSERPNN